MKAIMYHYVRPEPAQLPFLRYLHVDDFRRQLDYFQANFSTPGREDFIDAIAGRRPLAERSVVLTFDDGFADHLDHAIPELQRRGLWGIFYAPAGPYLSGRLLDVHRIHWLLGMHGGARVLAPLKKLISDDMLDGQYVEEFRRETYKNQNNSGETTLVKRILNYYISYSRRDEVLTRLMEQLSPLPEAEVVRQFYIPEKRLREVEGAGMLLGSHSVSHPVFSKLSRAEQEREIQDSFGFLEGATGGLKLRTFCYPYGGFHTFTSETEELLTANGCAFSFNVEARDITPETLKRPQALPRYDCNAFPSGQASGRAD